MKEEKRFHECICGMNVFFMDAFCNRCGTFNPLCSDYDRYEHVLPEIAELMRKRIKAQKESK
jgi:hypothetical protein